MANIPIRGKIVQDTIDGLKTSEYNLDLTKGNAFRIDKIQLKCDLDTILTTDMLQFQIAAEESSTLLPLDDPNEIYTYGVQIEGALSAGIAEMQKLREGLTIKDIEAFITDAKFWLAFDTLGQAAQQTLYFKIYGQYVNLKAKDLERIRSGATF